MHVLLNYRYLRWVLRRFQRVILPGEGLLNGDHTKQSPLDRASEQLLGRKFEVELRGETVVVRPLSNLREPDFQEIVAGENKVLAFLDHSQTRDVVVDLSRMAYSGSTALEFFIRLSAKVKSRWGRR